MGFTALALCALWAADSLLASASLKLGGAQAGAPLETVNASAGGRPSVFVVVDSRRSSFVQRSLVRDLWVRASSSTNAKVRFGICTGEDELKDRLKEEHTLHGDIIFMRCREGHTQGTRTAKVAAALDFFHNRQSNRDFFMKVDDDTFVLWTRLHPLLAAQGNAMSYMGVPVAEGVPCRNASHPWYEPFETFNGTRFPAGFAAGPGYILGKDLARAIVQGGFHQQHRLYNEDRAVGVWVDHVKQTGRNVTYTAIAGTDGPQASWARNWSSWKEYPHLLHHGLYGETIACLSVVERRKDPSHNVSHCFAREAGHDAHVPRCQYKAVGPKRSSVPISLIQRESTNGESAAAASTSSVVRLRPSLRSMIEADASGIPIPAGNTVDWMTHQQPLIFIHIPKNSGTAIEQSGHAAGVWWPRKWLSFWHGIEMPDGSQCEKYHVPPAVLHERHEADAHVFAGETFCVTRHPYERAVSEYKYMLSVKWGRSMSSMYQTGLYEKPACSAAGLNNFVQKAMKRVQQGKKFIHDCHFIPQNEFVYGKDGTQWCKHVLRNENLATEFNELMGRFRYPVRLQPDGEKINNSSGCSDVSVKDLSMKTLRMLDMVYMKDFDLFNYSRHRPMVGFVHIPRTGGGSIVASAAKSHSAFPGTSLALAERIQLPDSSWCAKRHVPLHFMEESDAVAFSNTENFCVTRHPYDRIVSSFLSFAQLPKKELGMMLKFYGLNKILEKDWRRDPCSAKTLNSFVKGALGVAEGGRPFALDCHLVPQTEYLWDPSGKRHCHVSLPFDKLDEKFVWFMKSRGFPDTRLGGDMLNQGNQSTPPGCQSLGADALSKEARALLARYYADDFALLNYTAW